MGFSLLAAGLGPSGAFANQNTSREMSPRNPKIIYQIFTRSFQDSDGDGIGDLNGIISRLDYLNNGKPPSNTNPSLGVDAIWLTPIFSSPSYHGYDVTDYQAIQPEYGDLTTFHRLINEAHRRGIRVILDLPVNHTSIENSWFQSSSSSESSPDRGLYLWSPTPLDWHQILLNPGETPEDHWHRSGDQFYFSTFGTSTADLNWRNPEVLHRIENVFRFWVTQGVDGFRLDAAKYLVKGPDGEQNTPETHQIWKAIVEATRQIAPTTYFIGEIWDSASNIASYYGHGNELDAAFDFPIAGALRDSLVHHDAGSFYSALKERAAVEPTPDFTSPFVGNHDMSRIATVVGGDPARLKLAALAVLSLPGTPTLYSGDELGIPDGTLPAHRGDLAKRTPMPWTEAPDHGFTSSPGNEWIPFSSEDPRLTVQAENNDPNSVLSTWRTLIHLRLNYPELNQGVLSDLHEPAAGVISFVRSVPDALLPRKVLVVLNFSNRALPSLSIPVSLGSGSTPIQTHPLYGNSTIQARPDGSIQVNGLTKSTGAVFLLQRSFKTNHPVPSLPNPSVNGGA